MKAWERKLLRLIYEHRDDADYIRCIETLCSEYSVSYRKVSEYMKLLSEGAKELATIDGL